MFFDLIGFFGFLLSLINLCYFFITRRKKIDVEISTEKILIQNMIHDTSTVIIPFKFVNQSQLPVSITRVQMFHAGKFYDCDNMPCLVGQDVKRVNNIVTDSISTHTQLLPINLDCLAANYCFLAFQLPRENPLLLEKDLIFQIDTNRGSLKSLKIERLSPALQKGAN